MKFFVKFSGAGMHPFYLLYMYMYFDRVNGDSEDGDRNASAKSKQ